MKAGDIAEKLNGVLEGDRAIEIEGVAGLEDAEPGEASFLTHSRYRSLMERTRAALVLVDRQWEGSCPAALLRVDHPDTAFARLAEWLAPPRPAIAAGVHPSAVLADDVELGPGTAVGPHCVLESGVRVGPDTVLEAGCCLGAGVTVGSACHFHAHVAIREGARIGNRVVLHNGAVIGSDGFGYARKGPAWEKIPQRGIVVIGDDVEIGANTTVDRARFGKTVIGNGVKIDNLVQVAHNCRIGDHSAIAALVGISGSATLGAGVQVGGQAGFAGHLTVGDQAMIAGRAGVTKDIAPGAFVSDFPAIPHREARRRHAHVMRLPELKKKVDRLEQRLRELETRREETA